ncbi:MAG: MBL fold metallo-hydrolase [Pirellulales bacterium]
MLARMKLSQVSDHCFAAINERNRLCDSNSGLINLGGRVVIDTQCDLGHARRMIELFGTVAPAMPERVVITHEDPDHVWGNQLFPDAQIIAQRKIVERLPHTSNPHDLQYMQRAARNRLLRIVLRVTNPGVLALADQLAEDYNFDGIELVLPDTVFEDRYELNLDGTQVNLLHVGPGHQWGDTMIHLPAEGVLFSGDVLFRQCTPMAWAGSYADWQRSLERVLELKPAVIVPGHGPICGIEGVHELQAYLHYVHAEARQCFERGLTEMEAAQRIDLGPYAEWKAPARIYFNVARAYREFRGEANDAPWEIPKVFAGMYKLAKARGLDVAF